MIARTPELLRATRRGIIAMVVVTVAAAVPVSAQGTRRVAAKKDPKWTLEILGGAFAGSDPSTGTAPAEFPAGTTFGTESGFPSRANPSWFFADGTTLFNEVRSRFGSEFGLQVPALLPVDSALASAGLERKGGTSFGVRITRRLTGRLALEVGAQRSSGKLHVTDAVRDAVETSRASFDAAFRALLGTMPQSGLQVAATADIPSEAESAQTALTGVVNVTLVRRGALAAHGSAGVGRVTNSARALDVRLRGTYQFRFLDTYPFNETDTVTIRYSDRETAVIGVFGGGITYDLAARHGVRFDVRVHTNENGMETSVEASPNVASGNPPLALPSLTNPSIQFSNTTALRSSLSGNLSRRPTFTGSGLESRLHFTAAYVLRF